MSETLRLAIVDDHTLFRKGLAELLEGRGGIHIVGATSKSEDACELMADAQPDVVLLDLNMPPLGGLAVFACLRATGCQAPVVILTVSEDDEDLTSALRAGVQGYLLKDMEPDELVDAIQRAVRGETVVAPTMTGKLVQLLQGGHAKSSDDELAASLTRREREVLTHLAQGASNKAIARALDISHDTVKLHVRHILTKLNLASRVKAAVFAVEHKLVATPAVPGLNEDKRPG